MVTVSLRVGLWACFWAAGLPVAAVAEVRDYDEATRLRHWALAHCVSLAYVEPLARADAGRSAAGYLELGASPMETYEAIHALAVLSLEQRYPTKSGESVLMMQCLDLMESKALQRIIEEAVRVKIG